MSRIIEMYACVGICGGFRRCWLCKYMKEDNKMQAVRENWGVDILGLVEKKKMIVLQEASFKTY